MKGTLAGLGLSVLIAALLLFSLNVKMVSAQNNNYAIQNVDHQVGVMYSGHVVISDTITLTGQTPNTFLIGFPYRYGNHIIKALAFDQAGTLPIGLGAQLGNQSGFYGAEITLPETSSEVFTVVFILSNDLIIKASNTISLDFPAYPSFTTTADRCAVTLALPANTTDVSISKSDGNVNATSFVKSNLAAFTNSPAVATFTLISSVIQQIDMKSLTRTITVTPAGEIRASDTYQITNNSPEAITSLMLDIPSEASNVVGKDEFGRELVTTTLSGTSPVAQTTLSLLSSMNLGETFSATLEYSLPNAPPEQTTQFNFSLDLFPVSSYFVDEATVMIVPPEGAHFVAPQLSSLDPSVSVNRELFQETLQIQRTGVSDIDRAIPIQTSLQITFDYNMLWLSFRPTMSVWAVTIIGSVLLVIWRRPKSTKGTKKAVVPRLSAGLSPDNVRAFTEAYEERKRITRELRVLHARAQKGRIPRNYYKSQRKTLETRVEALTKDISQLKGTFRSAGGVYGDLMRQLDAAENELGKARAKVREAETRHRTAELSIEDYKKALTEYQQQKEKLELQIDGILLRLREEIH
jgi:hypothetical protein